MVIHKSWMRPTGIKEERLWVRQQSSSQIFEGLACPAFFSIVVQSIELEAWVESSREVVLPLDKEYLTPEVVQQWGAHNIELPVLENSSRLWRGFCYSREGYGLHICRACSLKVNM